MLGRLPNTNAEGADVTWRGAAVLQFVPDTRGNSGDRKIIVAIIWVAIDVRDGHLTGTFGFDSKWRCDSNSGKLYNRCNNTVSCGFLWISTTRVWRVLEPSMDWIGFDWVCKMGPSPTLRRTSDYIQLNVHCCVLVSGRVRVTVGVRIIFSVWLASWLCTRICTAFRCHCHTTTANDREVTAHTNIC